MSFWDELKELLYKPVKQDSRNLEKLGQAWNLPWLENEANRNVDNPGRAVGKAAATAATWWLGNYGGDYGLGAAGSTAGNAAGTAASAAASAAANAFPAALSSMPVSEIAKLAAQNPAMYEGLLQSVQAAAPEIGKNSLTMGRGLLDYGKDAFAGAKSGMNGLLDAGRNMAYDTMVPGVGSQQAAMLAEQTGPFGAEGLAKTMQAASKAEGMNPMSRMWGEYGGKALANYSRGSGNKLADQMAQKMGGGLLDGGQQQPMPQQPPPRQQAPQGPLPTPYTNSLQGPPPGMSWEEWERLKRMNQQRLMGRM
jgi:hypothetical protein